MRIDSSFNFPQLPQRPKAPPALRDAATAGPEAAAGDAPRRRGFSVEAAQSQSQPRQERTEFYSTNRDLSLRGREALASYLTTASFQHSTGSGELVGVDIYV
jgi:hypothetical protein